MQEPSLDLGGERGARDVYDELLCDWPLLAPDDARTLTDALGDPVRSLFVRNVVTRSPRLRLATARLTLSV
jgi:hypothetical protein